MRGDLTNKRTTVVFGEDSVVIQKYISGVKGGRTLDVSGFNESVIHAGHVIIQDTASGVYKPMPVEGENYSTLPGSHVYAGVLFRTISTAKPFASIMTMGEVNSEAVPYAMTSILSAFKTACPLIQFIKDNAEED